MKSIVFIFCIFLLISANVEAQKKSLDHTAYKVWKNITHKKISDNGKWVAYDTKPMENGNPVLYIKNIEGNLVLKTFKGSDPSFTYDSKFFDYYLRDAPKTKWMRDGVSALEVGIKQGYEPVSTDGN